jgi:hypothetical protein
MEEGFPAAKNTRIPQNTVLSQCGWIFHGVSTEAEAESTAEGEEDLGALQARGDDEAREGKKVLNNMRATDLRTARVRGSPGYTLYFCPFSW